MKEVKILVWDSNETIDLTYEAYKGDYFYLPGTPGDTLTLKNGTNTETLSFNSSGNLSKSLNDVFKIGNKEFKVIGLGGGLIEGGDAEGHHAGGVRGPRHEGTVFFFFFFLDHPPV